MNIEDFLAVSGTPCINLRVGPGEYDVVNISQLYLETHQDELLQYCLGLREVEARNWQAMREFTSNNGLLAKVLIALGDLVGAWTMHPPRGAVPALWTSLNPRILSVSNPPAPPIPKPSSGVLDGRPCGCCHRPMGEQDSRFHDLVCSEADENRCFECEIMECDLDCKVFDQPAEPQRRRPQLVPEEEPVWGPPSGLEGYLNGFG